MTKAAIFDSSGLVALLKDDDTLRPEALRVGEVVARDDWQLLLPFEVYAETINLIGKKTGRKEAALAGRGVMERYAAGYLSFVPGEPHILRKALDLQTTATGAPSFVDCLVMAYADEYRTRYVFGFDATFKKNGYELPGSGSIRSRAA